MRRFSESARREKRRTFFAGFERGDMTQDPNARVAESMSNWVQDLLAYATQQAVDGKQWPGYKLVAGRSVRRYTGEAEVIKAATEAGFTDIYKTTLLGVGDLEKRMGRKKFGEVLGKYIVKPVGAPTLVPESDPRKPYADAASDFQ